MEFDAKLLRHKPGNLVDIPTDAAQGKDGLKTAVDVECLLIRIGKEETIPILEDGEHIHEMVRKLLPPPPGIDELPFEQLEQQLHRIVIIISVLIIAQRDRLTEHHRIKDGLDLLLMGDDARILQFRFYLAFKICEMQLDLQVKAFPRKDLLFLPRLLAGCGRSE